MYHLVSGLLYMGRIGTYLEDVGWGGYTGKDQKYRLYSGMAHIDTCKELKV